MPTMEGPIEGIPNSQEIIDMMLTMRPNPGNDPGPNFLVGSAAHHPMVVDNAVAAVDKNNNHGSNLGSTMTDLRCAENRTSACYDLRPEAQSHFLPEEELDQLQHFAQELLMAPHATLDGTSLAHQQNPGNYQDVKPTISKQEWLHANLNSTVVNQTLTDNPGHYGFRVFFDSHQKVTKNMTWTFSPEVGRLYVMLNSQCPFKVTTSQPPPDDSYIVVVPVYKDAVSRAENVVRCPHHCRNRDASGLEGKFWMNSPHPQAIYHEDIQNSNRHCLVVPFEKPHAGCQSYTYLFEFMCRNTCLGGVNRRATEVIFLLQHEGKELARAVVEVKVCACPGRDRRADETSLAKKLSVETAHATRPGHKVTSGQHGNGSGHSKAPRIVSSKELDSTLSILSSAENDHDVGPDGEQLFTLRIRGRSNYEILKRVAEGLELRSQHQRVKKRKIATNSQQQQQQIQMLNSGSNQQNSLSTPVHLNGVAVKREVEIVDSDG